MRINTLFLALMLCVAPYANALIVSVQGHGEIPAEGMELTITEGEQDILSGKYQMSIYGNLLSITPLTVTITRSAANLDDEFCCSERCTPGNQQSTETLYYTPNGVANWYVHYRPAQNSDEKVQYVFHDGIESRTLSVNYIYKTEGIDQVTSHPKENTIFTLSGMQLEHKSLSELPSGIYIVNGKKIQHISH
jgi:hypothetical protein